ncbi:DMT family transporter [uncultured Neptuniibacter sp.]|uniref:DMT family transporter n=1 Tax=uncultured Neptuniibacter sp. TaxID=502143 RepID=UPI0026292CCD|nr:DMT family transporter [uncultured Neptuniibacter sp.]
MIASIPAAIRYMLLSALGFSLMAACVKAVGQYGIPVLEIVAARAIVSLFLSYLDVKRKRISVWGYNKPLLIARGVTGALALVCVYYAVTTLTLADATVLQYTYPAFTALLALLFLGERIKQATMLCILLSFIGVIVMMRPGFGDVALIGIPALSLTAALAGALGSAAAYVIVRKLSQTEDSSVIIFYFPLVALPASLLMLGSDFVMPGAEALLLLLLVGIFTQVGQIGLTKAMAAEAAGKASAYAYVQVIFSALLGILFFDEIPTVWTLIGGALILTGALVNALWKR